MTDSTAPVRLGDMTAPAFAKAAAGNPVILLPLGSHEDHGPHQPMGDYVLAEVIAERIVCRAAAQGVVSFVAPSLPYGVADYFGSSPGGLALAPESFRRVLEDLLGGLLRHGLTKIVILNAHGGNVPVIHQVTLDIRRQLGVVIPSFYLWKIARQLMEGRIGGGRFGHGAEPLMSMNMALRPNAILPDTAAPDEPAMLLGLKTTNFGTLEFEGLAVEAPVEFDQTPREAIAPAWAGASAALGDDVTEALVAAGARFVAHINNISGT